jgi:tetratricopeptide (TPR) repeat protein
LTFETDLTNNPVLAGQLALAREARERLNRSWANEQTEKKLKERLQNLGDEYFQPASLEQERPSGKEVRMRWWMAVAAILIIVLVSIVALPPKEQRLYAQLRHFPEANFVSKGANNDASLNEANQAFNHQDYSTALAAFESYLKTHPDHTEAKLFAAFCQLELKNYPAAETAFKALHNSTLADEADWFLALTYLREKDRDRCKSQLQQINSGNPHYQDAQQLMHEL